MPEILLDSSVLIDVLRGVDRAKAYARKLSLNDTGLVHGVCIAELVAGARDAVHQNSIVRLLRQFQWLQPNEADATVALQNFMALHLSQRVGYFDCLIAATALRLNSAVATTNDRHFRRFNGLTVIRPY